MPRISEHPEIKPHVTAILNSVPEHLRILISGEIEIILIKYESECTRALSNLTNEISGIKEWIEDGLKKAIEESEKLV